METSAPKNRTSPGTNGDSSDQWGVAQLKSVEQIPSGYVKIAIENGQL